MQDQIKLKYFEKKKKSITAVIKLKYFEKKKISMENYEYK